MKKEKRSRTKILQRYFQKRVTLGYAFFRNVHINHHTMPLKYQMHSSWNHLKFYSLLYALLSDRATVWRDGSNSCSCSQLLTKRKFKDWIQSKFILFIRMSFSDIMNRFSKTSAGKNLLQIHGKFINVPFF